MPDANDLLMPTDKGLWCAAGGFHVDPWKPVDRAVITHAHADHATPGSGAYLCSSTCAPILRARLGENINIQPLAFAERIRLHNVTVSLHPAGHVLGSAQIRIEPADAGPTWVVTGDYKTDTTDKTCEPFEPVPCDTLLTESTFGLPIYRWRPQQEIFDDINVWWARNAGEGRTTVLLAYSLGKAQRVLAGLDPSIGPIGVHGAVLKMCAAYEHAGITLPPFVHADKHTAATLKGKGVIVTPPSAMASTWSRRFRGPNGLRTGSVSGWMAVRGRRRWQAVDRGFPLSDHADWDGLLGAIDASGASRIGVTHGAATQLARWLRESRGLDTFVVPTRFKGEADESDADNGASEDAS